MNRRQLRGTLFAADTLIWGVQRGKAPLTGAWGCSPHTLFFSLDEDNFARLHIMKRYHRDDADLSRFYATWIRISGAQEELGKGETDGWTDVAGVRQRLGRDLLSLDSMLASISQPDGFVSKIAHALETNRSELDELSK